MAMGQANAVTPIQLATAVGAVANQGNLMKPYLVKQVVGRDGQVLQQNQPVAVRQVITPETARRLCAILEGEVVNGTGKNAFIEGYRVGGKTGTAQKIAPGGGYLANEYVASFVGFAPAQKPRLLCLVVVDAPQGYPYYGGWVAAPVFQAIMKDALRYLDEPLYNTGAQQQTLPKDELVSVPDVVNLPLEQAVQQVRNRGLQAKVNGTGSIVWQQTPKAHTRVQKGTQVIIDLSATDKGSQAGTVTVPDLQGKSMKEVAQILSSLGLHLIPEGYGLAYEQVPAAGKVITSGSTVTVKFQPVSE
jgi:stage V sporulation protein D (sporulation-specific penicillin-binding protein)